MIDGPFITYGKLRPPRKAIVLLSGGCDSATSLWIASAEFPGGLYALSFNYGQRHVKELECAKALVTHLNMKVDFAKNPVGNLPMPLGFQGGAVLEHKIADIANWKQLATAPLIDSSQKIPTQVENKQSATVVPGRNTIFLTTAAIYADLVNVDDIYIAPVREDWLSYPDCRPEYLELVEQVLRLGVRPGIRIHAPLVRLWKREIVRYGYDLGVPYELTWTCYEGKELACGKCDACVERIRSFAEAGIKDPMKYEED